MNIYFAYTIAGPEQIYYGKYFGYASNNVTEHDLLAAIYPSLQMCYSSAVKSTNDITLSILSSESTSVFTDRDPFKYKFVYNNTSPIQIYLNGTLMA